jgi:diacylglycerol kinase (ATP)
MNGRDQGAIAIVNPTSAAGRTGRRWKQIRLALRRHLGVCEEALTEYPGHATEITRAALQNGHRMIVVVGGDGTLGEVAAGFFLDKKAYSDHVMIGYIPQGTGADFGRTLGIENDWEQASARLASGRPRLIDVGHVEFVDHSGARSQRIFVNVASFGCGGAVSRAVAAADKRMGGRLAYTMTTFRTLVRYHDQSVVITIDDDEAQELSITNFAVCNARFFGGGMQVAPSAQVDDGQLDVTVWSGYRLRDFIFKQRALFDGSHIDDPRTRTRKIQRLRATSDQPVLLDVDGENPGCLPASFSIIPGALRFKM